MVGSIDIVGTLESLLVVLFSGCAAPADVVVDVKKVVKEL